MRCHAHMNELCRGFTLHRTESLGFIITPADDFYGLVPGALLEEFRGLMQWFDEEVLPVMWLLPTGWVPIPRAVVALCREQPPDAAGDPPRRLAARAAALGNRAACAARAGAPR